MSRPDRHVSVVVIGGGVVGAALALVLARDGTGVLVLERQPAYRDRVRGEALAPWGSAEARELGIDGLLRENGAVLDRVYAFDELTDPAAVLADPSRVDGLFDGVPGVLGIGHPRFTTAVSEAAGAAGADVRRGAKVAGVAPGRVTFFEDGDEVTVTTSLVVGADGKDSQVRAAIGEPLHRSGPTSRCTGMLVADLGADVPLDAVSTGIAGSRSTVVFPQAGGRARLYQMTAEATEHRYRGDGREARFLEDAARAGIPWGDGVAAATPAGPCATFPILDSWTDDPVRDGLVLVGDAAGASNPLCAQGMAVCLRDVRVVRDALRDAPSGGRGWTAGTFAAYRDDRAERMRRLRVLARFFTAYSVPGAIAPEDRAALHRRVHGDADHERVLWPMQLGPYAAPDEVFDPAWIVAATGIDVDAAA